MSIYNISTEKEETKEYIVISGIVIPSVGYDLSDFLIREKTTKKWTMINKYSFLKTITLVKLWVSVKEGADIISL